jgi:hypothetical protein
LPAEVTAPVAAAKGVPTPVADADEAPLAPLSPDAELKDQINRAKEVTARAERKAAKAAKAPAPKPTKGKAKAAATEPTEEPVSDTEPAPPPEEEEPPQLTAPSAAMLVKARQLAEQGDLEAAIKLAFGKPAEAFRLNSARWAEWRKTQDKASKATAEREGRVQAAAQQLQKDYGPLVEARKLFEAEDYEGAFQKAFGLDLNSFQKKALSKYHGKNPEIEALKRQLAERDERDAKARQEHEQRQAQQAEQAQHQANEKLITTHLGGSDDPQLAALAAKPRFIRQVYREFLSRVQSGEPASMILVAACAEEIRDGLIGEFGEVFVPRNSSDSEASAPGRQNPGSPHQAGKKPARPGAAAAAPISLSQRGASEASPPGRALSDAELFKKYTALAKTATG